MAATEKPNRKVTLQLNTDHRLSLAPSVTNIHSQNRRQSKISDEHMYNIPLSHPKHWSHLPHHIRLTEQEIRDMLEEINKDRCEKHKNFIYDHRSRRFVYKDLEDLIRYQNALRKFDELNELHKRRRTMNVTINEQGEESAASRARRWFDYIRAFMCLSRDTVTETVIAPKEEDNIYCCRAFGRCCLAGWCCIFTAMTCGLFKYSGLVETDADMIPRSVMRLTRGSF